MKNTSITPRSAIHNPRSAIRNLLGRRIPAPFARARSVVVALAGLVVLLATHQSATAAGVAVGSSTLIGTPQYSDTWTTTGNGGIAGRAVDTLPTGTGLDVENNYGNTARAWTPTPGLMRTDATVVSGSYPGTSSAGSATGIIETASNDWFFDYGLSSNFVIQTDATQATDRVNLTFGPSNGLFGTNNIAIFFRNSAAGVKIGIFSNGLGEYNTGFTSGIASNYTWNNYAIKVDTSAKTIEFFTNEVSRGILDLNTFSGGAFASRMSNAKVGIGMNSSIGWTDNFQVGLPGSSLTACDMLSLNWGASVGSISGTAVTLAVPYGTDVTTLNPTYTVSPLATGAPVSGTARNFTTPQTYRVTAQDGITFKDYTVTVTVSPPSTACDMLSLSWGAFAGTISGTAVTLTVPIGTDVTTLNPTYTVSPLATGAPVSGTARNFTSPQTYTVTAQDGISQKVYTVTVAFNPVIILTGGDAGEGFAPLNNTYAAVSLSQAGVGSVQGVTFNTNASAVTMTGNPGVVGGGANFTKTTTDDTNLGNVFTHGYYTGSSITATVTGLTAGLVYQLDSFIGVMGSSGRTEYVQVFDGLTPLTANQQVDLLGASPTLSPAYDIRQTFTAPAGGTVQVKYTGSFFPLLCGLAITYAAPVSAYDAWANGTFTPALTAKLPTDNQDGDTLINLQEYAFGTQPTVSTGGSISYVAGGAITATGLPVATNFAVGGGVDYRGVFGRRKDYVAAGLTYTPQFSVDLVSWTNSAATPTVLTGAGGLNPSEIEAVSVPYPLFIPYTRDGIPGFEKPTFFRVGVSQP